jgi:spermidine/putrescine transport system ATP-binding protein
MTMADTIAVMHQGRIERMGAPTEIYEDPRTAFVAGFLGASNMMEVSVLDQAAGATSLRGNGTKIYVEAARLAGASSDLRLGVRPEKIRLFEPDEANLPQNLLDGTVTDASFIGVSTHYLVATDQIGEIAVMVQNLGDHHHRNGDRVKVGWHPENTFVVT